MILRTAVASDVPDLDAIALAAKAHWGYSAEQLEAWRNDLTVDVRLLRTQPVCVADDDGELLGFAQVSMAARPWELEALWVHPRHMGKGVGRALLAWASALATSHGELELAIDADPHAEGFYRACGAVVVGHVAAPIDGNALRVRPQLRLRVKLA